MTKIFAIASLAFLGLALPMRFTKAHQTGASWEKEVDGYKVDVGYDPVNFVAGQSQRLDFNAYDVKVNIPVDFSDVWVRVSQGEQTVFASGIHKPEFGATGMMFIFPKEGNYTLSARFENSEKTFVEASFPLTVAPAEMEKSVASLTSAPLVLSGLAGLFIGAGAVWAFFGRRKKE